jgi:hypothetical protein
MRIHGLNLQSQPRLIDLSADRHRADRPIIRETARRRSSIEAFSQRIADPLDISNNDRFPIG